MILLTDRCYCIINFLLEQKKPITIKKIASNFGVSERTVRYDLDVIEDWLKERKVQLKKKSRVGIWIEGNEKSLEELKEQLNLPLLYDHVYSFKERKKIILNTLFERQNPISIKELANRLNVSRTTIINDLNAIEEWLERWDIKLLRKPNYGIKIICDEMNWRKGVINYIYENVDKASLLEFLNITRLKFAKNSRIDFLTNKQIMDLFSGLDLKQLEECINFIEEQLNIKFVDAALVGLIMHIALAVKRLQKKKQISMPAEQLNTLKNTKEFEIAKIIAKRLENSFNVKIPVSEIGYITLHILGAKVRENFSAEFADNNVKSTSQEIFLVKQLIKRASQYFDVNLENDKELENSLLMHLKPTLNRLKHNMNISNPLLKEIKSIYPEVFEGCKWACRIIEDTVGTELNEDEIGYITMHIGASLERNKDNVPKKRHKVLVVCSSGIGTASMLSTRLKKEFPNLIIKKQISLAELENNLTQDIDFLITTIPIDNIYFKPIIHVSPLLTQEDINLIENVINLNRHNEKLSATIIEDLLNIIEKNCMIKDRTNLIKELQLYFNTNKYRQKGEKLPVLLDLITEKTVAANVDAKDWEDAIKKSGQLLVNEGFVKSSYIDAMISTAKTMRSYIVIAPGVALPHARPESGVNKVCMSLITLKKPVEFGHPKNDPVKVVISLGAIDNHTHLRALSELSDFLDNESIVKELVQCKNKKEIINLIRRKQKEQKIN